MDLREHLSSLSSRPQKILKIVIAISAVLLLMWLFLISQMEYTGNRQVQKPVSSERVDSLDTLLGQNRQPVVAKEESSGIFMNAVTTFVILLAVLGGIWFWTSRKTYSGPSTKKREIGSHALGEGAQIKIIEVNGEVWVLGVTPSSVNLLHRYPQNEWNERDTEKKPSNQKFAQIFKSKT